VVASKEWYASVAAGINGLQSRLSRAEQKRYKLPRLLRLAGKVSSLSDECQQCQSLKPAISRLTRELAEAAPSQRTYREYKQVTIEVTAHLKRRHRLVEERQYLKRFVSLSASLSLLLVLLGYFLVNFGITLLVLSVTLPISLLRIAFSSIFGHFLDRRARKQGRVI